MKSPKTCAYSLFLDVKAQPKRLLIMQYYDKIHGGEKRLFLKFPYDRATINKLKKIADFQWSGIEKAWHVGATNLVFEKLKEMFPDLQPLNPLAANKSFEKSEQDAKFPKKQTVKAVQYKTGLYCTNPL